MKITKLEWAALCVTALTLIAMIFYFIGIRAAARPVDITAQTPRPSLSAAQSGSCSKRIVFPFHGKVMQQEKSIGAVAVSREPYL